MAAGRPVFALATQDSDLAQVINQTNCGISVEPEDAIGMAKSIQSMIERREELDNMGMNGRLAIETDFNRERIIAHLEQLMFKVVKKG
jgi:glycosyltransferase involved in cell wall biosynthesis